MSCCISNYLKSSFYITFVYFYLESFVEVFVLKQV
nr:MAG TPA: hypothetical protein [Caudoviricetes sp.]